MPRLRRFPHNRFVGTRDDMRAHDCEDPDEFAALDARVTAEDLLGRGVLTTFAPDTLAEARNRGFRHR